MASQKAGVTWRSWWDGEGQIRARYGAPFIPVFVLIDARGNVRHKLELDDAERLDELIEALLREK